MRLVLAEVELEHAEQPSVLPKSGCGIELIRPGPCEQCGPAAPNPYSCLGPITRNLSVRSTRTKSRWLTQNNDSVAGAAFEPMS